MIWRVRTIECSLRRNETFGKSWTGGKKIFEKGIDLTVNYNDTVVSGGKDMITIQGFATAMHKRFAIMTRSIF